MVTPPTVYDYHPAANRLETLKVQRIPSGYDPSRYVTERIMVPARDGRRIPVSIVYRRGFERNGQGRLFLYAYGAYGYATPPAFNTNRFSLLDRGYAFAIAHIRGGDEMGYDWYLQGKLDRRTNTFNDFVDAARGADRRTLYARRQHRDPGPLGRRRADGRGGQSGARNCGARWSPTCRSSTSSTPCSTKACR